MGDVLRSMDRGVESANQVVSYLFLYLIPAIVESIVVVIIFGMHFELATLSLVALVALIFYTYVTVNITLWRKKFREATTKHDNEYHDKATDCLTNFETVKYFTNEAFEVGTFKQAIKKYQKHSVSTRASLSLLNASQALIIQITIFASLAIAIPHVINADHNMDLGSFVAINVYLMNLFIPLGFLGSIYNMVIKAYVDMKKLGELLAVEPDIADHANAKPLMNTEQAITVDFNQVTFHYPTQDPLSGLRNVSFTIPPGTTTALVGHTGSGKSTISRLLFRFYDIEHGEILINKQNIKLIQQQSLRKSIGIVPQDVVLFNDTILHNIKYGRMDARMEDVEQAAKDARIYDFIQALPLKWNTSVGERGLRLSGGEKQRIAIARTLLKNPPLVILDEATSALDNTTEKEIQDALASLRVNRTMLVIAHRLTTICNANEIIVLNNGTIIEKGTHDELLERNGEYKRLWNSESIREQEY